MGGSVQTDENIELLYSVTGALAEHKYWEYAQKEVKDPPWNVSCRRTRLLSLQMCLKCMKHYLAHSS